MWRQWEDARVLNRAQEVWPCYRWHCVPLHQNCVLAVWSSSAPDPSSAAWFRCIICRSILLLVVIVTARPCRIICCPAVWSRRIVCRLSSAQRQCCSCHHCNLLLTPNAFCRAIRFSSCALVTLSAHRQHCCLDPLQLRLLLLRLPPPALVVRLTTSTTTSPPQ